MTQPPGDPTQPAPPAQPAPPDLVRAPDLAGAPTVAPGGIPAQPFPTAQQYPPTQGYPQPFQPPGYPPTQGYPQPFQPPGYPPSQGYPQPFQPQPYPGYLGQPADLGYPQQPPPRKRRGLLIGILAAVFVLLLAGGGVSAFLLTRDSGKGQASPQAAVDGFLTAVYTNQDATAAAKFVCPQARDTIKLTAKIDEIKKQNSQYELPRYSWKQPVKADFHSTADEVELVTTVTMRTSTEQHAEQPLLFVATRSNGWWVCEVKQGG